MFKIFFFWFCGRCNTGCQVSGRSVAIATTCTQHRTAVTAHFLFALFVADYPRVAFTASQRYYLGSRIYMEIGEYFISVDDLFFSNLFGVVDHFLQKKKS